MISKIDELQSPKHKDEPPKLLEWEKQQIMREQIAKWDGKMPGVMGSSNMLLNIPAPK